MWMRKAEPAKKRTTRSLRTFRRWAPGVLVGAVLVLPAIAQRASAQNSPYNTGPAVRGQLDDSSSPLGGETGNLQMEARRLDALNAERQKALVSDTDKLLKLTAELNAEINGTHPASLTQAQLRMVAEIEKLAHNIRVKMCTSVKGIPQMLPATPVMLPPTMQ